MTCLASPRLLDQACIFCVVVALSVAGPRAALAGDTYDPSTSYYAGLNCGQLWYERNQIMANHGYCFKSARAVNTFGKACFPPYGKLPSNFRNVVKEIKGWERQRGC